MEIQEEIQTFQIHCSILVVVPWNYPSPSSLHSWSMNYIQKPKMIKTVKFKRNTPAL